MGAKGPHQETIRLVAAAPRTRRERPRRAPPARHQKVAERAVDGARLFAVRVGEALESASEKRTGRVATR